MPLNRKQKPIRAFIITESHSTIIYAQTEEVAVKEFQANPSIRRTELTIKTLYNNNIKDNQELIPRIAARLV